MGKGSYSGGSTVIGPRSGWFSNNKKKSEADPPPRKKDSISFYTIKENYLRKVLEAQLERRIIPEIPKEIVSKIGDAIEKAGGVESWAEEQAFYILERGKKNKYHKKITIDFLCNVINHQLRNKKPPKVPNKIITIYGPLIDRAGGIERWLEEQPFYTSIKARITAKFAAKQLHIKNQFLQSAIGALKQGKELPCIPNSIRLDAEPAIELAGGMQEWVENECAIKEKLEQQISRKKAKAKAYKAKKRTAKLKNNK